MPAEQIGSGNIQHSHASDAASSRDLSHIGVIACRECRCAFAILTSYLGKLVPGLLPIACPHCP